MLESHAAEERHMSLIQESFFLGALFGTVSCVWVWLQKDIVAGLLPAVDWQWEYSSRSGDIFLLKGDNQEA